MRVLITGPESSGKTTLARRLAWALDGRYVAEAARAYLNARGGRYTEADLVPILQRQLAAERAAAAAGASLVVCDTGPEVLEVWSLVKYGRVAPAIAAARRAAYYDLALLCAPDLPYAPDPLRETPDPAARRRLFDRYRSLLHPDRTVVIQGTHGRTSTALAAIIKKAGSDAGSLPAQVG